MKCNFSGLFLCIFCLFRHENKKPKKKKTKKINCKFLSFLDSCQCVRQNIDSITYLLCHNLKLNKFILLKTYTHTCIHTYTQRNYLFFANKKYVQKRNRNKKNIFLLLFNDI